MGEKVVIALCGEEVHYVDTVDEAEKILNEVPKTYGTTQHCLEDFEAFGVCKLTRWDSWTFHNVTIRRNT